MPPALLYTISSTYISFRNLLGKQSYLNGFEIFLQSKTTKLRAHRKPHSVQPLLVSMDTASAIDGTINGIFILQLRKLKCRECT